MTRTKNRMQIISENNHRTKLYRDDSFVGKLRKEGMFDIVEYRKLENALYDLLKYNDEVKLKNEVISFGIISTHVLKLLVSHESDDEYEIHNCTREEMYRVLERIRALLKGVTDGLMPKEENIPELPKCTREKPN